MVVEIQMITCTYAHVHARCQHQVEALGVPQRLDQDLGLVVEQVLQQEMMQQE